jgi:tetratricopeptide (TPR) repeat protein
VKIMPGVRLNVSKRGVGYSVGTRGYRVSHSASGRVTRTVSIPGTGISHRSTIRSGSSRGGSRPSARYSAPPPPAPPRPPQPGLLAPKWEKDLFAALSNGRYAEVARAHGHEHPDVRLLAACLDGLHEFTRPGGTPERARELLGWAAANGARSIGAHPFAAKYLGGTTWPVEIADGIVAHLGLAHDVVLLAAAELHQAAGDLDAAIWLVEAAEPTAPAALSLVELYSAAERHSDVIDTTNGITNEDDASALLLVLRGRAFAQLAYYDAAREALKSALARKRAPEVVHRALIERAEVNVAQNRKAMARKDLEKVLADDPSYPGLREALDALG